MMKLLVLSCMVATACASGIIAAYAPFGFNAVPFFGYGNPGFNYRGPLSLAPGQPASILGADGRPLDTLDVNLDKSAHFTAKALEGSSLHLLKKRSVSLVASSLAAPLAAPLALPYAAGVSYASPYAYAPYSGFNGYTGFTPYSGYTTPFGYLK